MGYWAAKFLHERKALIVGVAEYDGSVYNEKGIDPDDLKNFIIKSGGVKGYDKAKFMEKESAMYQPCDILVPAAMEKALHVNNAGRV